MFRALLENKATIRIFEERQIAADGSIIESKDFNESQLLNQLKFAGEAGEKDQQLKEKTRDLKQGNARDNISLLNDVSAEEIS